MVICLNKRKLGERAWLMIELLAAMVLLGAALVPLAFSLAAEKRLARAYYQKAVATEIVDGELEVLAAGQWKRFPQGKSEYRVDALAVTNLPPGQFNLEVRDGLVRLEWKPAGRGHGGVVVREVRVQ